MGEAYQNKYGVTLDEESVNQRVRMVIVASKMDRSTERIIGYLGQSNVDINILFFSVFEINGERIISRAWLKDDEEDPSLIASKISSKWNNQYYVSFGEYENDRQWSDALEYGFVSAGGGALYTRELRKLKTGDRVWVKISSGAYVGYGEVISEPMTVYNAIFEFNGSQTRFLDLPLKGKYLQATNDPDEVEHLVKVKWIKAVAKKKAVWEFGFFGNQHVVCQPTAEKWLFTVKRLREIWGISE